MLTCGNGTLVRLVRLGTAWGSFRDIPRNITLRDESGAGVARGGGHGFRWCVVAFPAL